MSLLKIAQEKAEATRKAEEQERKEQRESHNRREKYLQELYEDTLSGLREFDLAECKGGILRLVMDPDGPNWRSHSAKIIYEFTSTGCSSTLLTINGKIVSGTFDASDDCRDIPYTSPTLIIESPITNANVYKGSHREFCESTSDKDKVKDLLQKTAEYLSKWF